MIVAEGEQVLLGLELRNVNVPLLVQSKQLIQSGLSYQRLATSRIYYAKTR